MNYISIHIDSYLILCFIGGQNSDTAGQQDEIDQEEEAIQDGEHNLPPRRGKRKRNTRNANGKRKR